MTPPAPQGPNPGPQALLSRIAVTDLLLVLIVNLGIMRLASLVVGGLLGAASGGRTDPQPGNETFVLVLTLALILFQAIVMLGTVQALVLKKYGLTWSDLGVLPGPKLWHRRAVLLGLGIIPLVTIVNAATTQFLQEPFENPQLVALAPAGFSWPAMIGMMLMGGIVAPIAEEIAFRGLLFGWLRERTGFVLSAFLSGLCFATLHGIAPLIPALVAVGFALAWIRERSGSVLPAIISHSVFNMVMIVTLYTALARGVGAG